MIKLFSRKKEKHSSVYAPVNGTVIPESEIPDEAFASGMLGHGVGIIPKDSCFYSPVDATVIDVTPTKHAYSLLASDGTEILLHIGIDTVTLNGKGFESLVKKGDKIKLGAPLARVDFDVVENAELSIITALIIINHDELSEILVKTGDCKIKETEIIRYKKKKKNGK